MAGVFHPELAGNALGRLHHMHKVAVPNLGIAVKQALVHARNFTIAAFEMQAMGGDVELCIGHKQVQGVGQVFAIDGIEVGLDQIGHLLRCHGFPCGFGITWFWAAVSMACNMSMRGCMGGG